MSVQELIYYPDPKLTEPCEEVVLHGPHLARLIQDLEDTMYAKGGMGLAAPQLGVLKKIAIVDTVWEESGKRNPVVLINPQITRSEGEISMREGCLSIPRIHEYVTRAQKIKVVALDANLNKVEFEAEDLLAVSIQHEVEHLNEKLILDHLPESVTYSARRVAEARAKKLRRAQKRASL